MTAEEEVKRLDIRIQDLEREKRELELLLRNAGYVWVEHERSHETDGGCECNGAWVKRD